MSGYQSRETGTWRRGGYQMIEAEARGGRGLRTFVVGVVACCPPQRDAGGVPTREDHVGVSICFGEVEGRRHLDLAQPGRIMRYVSFKKGCGRHLGKVR